MCNRHNKNKVDIIRRLLVADLLYFRNILYFLIAGGFQIHNFVNELNSLIIMF